MYNHPISLLIELEGAKLGVRAASRKIPRDQVERETPPRLAPDQGESGLPISVVPEFDSAYRSNLY